MHYRDFLHSLKADMKKEDKKVLNASAIVFFLAMIVGLLIFPHKYWVTLAFGSLGLALLCPVAILGSFPNAYKAWCSVLSGTTRQ